MTIEILKVRELVGLKPSETLEGRSGVAAFEYQFPVDLDEVAIKRHLLGLDGAEAAPLGYRKKSEIATKLRRLGFLTDSEILELGGKLIKT